MSSKNDVNKVPVLEHLIQQCVIKMWHKDFTKVDSLPKNSLRMVKCIY